MSKLLSWVFGIFFALSFTGLMLLWWENTELQNNILRNENTITVLTGQRDELARSNEGLVRALTVQNDAVKRLGELKEALDKVFSTFSIEFVTTNKKITSIKDAINNEATPATCKDTIQYLKDARKELK